METFFFSKLVERGSPVFLNGLLHETASSDLFDVGPQYDWYWAAPGEQLAKLPPEIYLLSKEQVIDFDIRAGERAGDFIVSRELIEVLDTLPPLSYEKSLLHVVGRGAKPPSEKEYFYIRLKSGNKIASSMIDADASDIERRRTGEIKRYVTVAFKDGVNLDIFAVNADKLSHHLFVSRRMKSVLSNYKWIGFSIEPTSSLSKMDRV
jgi:hypothetical protein